MPLEPCPKHNCLPVDLWDTGEYDCEVCYEEALQPTKDQVGRHLLLEGADALEQPSNRGD